MRTAVARSSRLLKKTHMLRCRSIASLQRTVSTPLLVDFSRASHLDLFEQPARGFFQHPARLRMVRRSTQPGAAKATFVLEKCPRLRRKSTTVFQGCCAGPALEGSIECAGVRVAEHESNLRKSVLFFLDVLQGQPLAGIVD
jgi:hypothetical protein